MSSPSPVSPEVPSISSARAMVELSSLGSSPQHAVPNFQHLGRCSVMGTCWRVVSWIFSIVIYIMEFFIYIWVSYFYIKSAFPHKYLLFGLSIGFLVIPMGFVAAISLVWYYNLDRFHRRRRERDPHNLQFIEYMKKFTAGTVVLHVFTLGVIYRFSQLVYFAFIGKQSNLPYLRRDAILVRFIHAFLVSAPHLVLHLYVTLVTIKSTSSAPTYFYPTLPLYAPAVLSALAISTISVLYSTLSFSTSDRVSGKNRRVIMPAHVTQILWHLCMLASRLLALALFAYIYHYYIFVLIGAHWIVMLILLVVQRTTFCADLERMPDGELKFTRRWLLEVPFDVVASIMYIFIYFNLKRRQTKLWGGIYHLLTLAENTTMAALVYIKCSRDGVMSNPFFPETVLALVVGLYVAGIFFMLAYYVLYHPKRTECCFWVGLPKKCCPCCLSEQSVKEDGRGRDLRSQVGNGIVVISEPTLVSHNGFIPRNLVPVGPRVAEMGAELASTDGGSATSEGITTTQNSLHTQSLNGLNVRVCREDCVSEMDARLSASLSIGGNTSRIGPVGARRGGRRRRPGEVGHEDITSTVTPPINTTPIYATPRSCRTQTFSISNAARLLSGSNIAFSDGLASELDTVIDSPLFESSLIASNNARCPHKGHRSRSGGVGKGRGGKDVDSQRSCTDDTGIDVDSDPQLTQGTIGDLNEAEREKDGSVLYEDSYKYGGGEHLPVFTDAPANRYKHQNGSRQQPYSSAETEDGQELLLPPSSQFQDHRHNNHTHQNSTDNHDSVTPTLPTPTYSSASPSELTPSSHRKQPSKRDTTPGSMSSDSQPLSECLRNNPRSPLSARAFQGSSSDDVDGSDDVAGSTSPPRQFLSRNPIGGLALGSSPQILSSNSAQRAPRSPKGARHSLVQPHHQMSSSTCRLSMDMTGRSKDFPSRPHANPPPPPHIPSKDSNSARTPQDVLTKGMTSPVSSPTTTGVNRRAISSSPFFKPMSQVKPHTAPSAERISGIPYHIARPPANFSREISNGARLVSRDRQHQRRSKYESWHSEKVLDSNDSPNLPRKRMSTISAVEGCVRHNSHPAQNISAFTRIPQDRNSSNQHMYPRSQSRPAPTQNEWRSPPRGGRSISMDNYVGGIPRLTKQGSTAHHHHPQSHQANPPHYPRHPQGAMANGLRMSQPPRNKLASMPTRTHLKNTDNNVDKPLGLRTSSRSASVDGGSSNRNRVNRNSTRSPGVYDKLECEKTPEEQAQQQSAHVPPIRMHHGENQPQLQPHHQTLYAPISSAHESAV